MNVIAGEITISQPASPHLGVTLPRAVAERLAAGGDGRNAHFSYILGGAAGMDFLFMSSEPRTDGISYQLSERRSTSVPQAFRLGELPGESIQVAYVEDPKVDGVVVARLGDFATRFGDVMFSRGVTARHMGAVMVLAAYGSKPKIAQGLQEQIAPLVPPDIALQIFPELTELTPPVVFGQPGAPSA